MTATIAVVDVGQGDCTVGVNHSNGQAFMIDCPSGRHQKALEELTNQGFTELSVAMVTHTHADHFGGVLDVLEELQDRFTGVLYFNQDSLLSRPVSGEDRAIAGKQLRALLLRAAEYDGRLARAEAPLPAIHLDDLSLSLLAPIYSEVVNAITVGDPNLASGVVLISLGDDHFVVGGDAQVVTWERVAGSLPQGSVVRWPHHGGSLGAQVDADERVLAVLAPSAVLVSIGSSNSHGHPTESFFTTLPTPGLKLLCTQATSKCVAGGGAGGTCAGTIRVHLTGGGSSLSASPANHAEVVAAFGNGRCLQPS